MHLGITSVYTILFSLLLCACQRQIHSKPSTLLIALEGWSGSNFSCSSFEEAERSGFQILCNEAIRFTHAYTPSPMAQAALGSILTGESPRENGLRDNGNSFLSAQPLTFAEKLLKQNIRTFFVVAAPTVKRYSRLNQGFEAFNDDYDLSYRNIYRPVTESLSIFKDWLENEVSDSSFFATIHIADLLFPEVLTQSEFLETRPRGYEGQLEEIDENLFLFFTFLKHQNLWDKLYLVVTGLNGMPSYNRQKELPGTNLFIENVSVPLFIKAPKGREEIPHQWKIDTHVSLQDINSTLEEIFKIPNDRPKKRPFAGISLLSLIRGKSDPRFLDRPLMIESSWAHWTLDLPPRYSIREGPWLAIFDRKPALYNTLIDRNEMNKVPTKDASYQVTIDRLSPLLGESFNGNYEQPNSTLSDEIRFVQLLVENYGHSIDFILGELHPLVENNSSSEIIRWLFVDQLLRQRKWDLIENFNSLWKDELITQVMNLKYGRPLPQNHDPCLELLSTTAHRAQPSALNKRDCTNNDFLTLIDLLNAPPEKKDLLLDRFAVIYKHQALKLKLIYFDISHGGVALGANIKDLRYLILFKMALGLPRFQREAAQIERRMSI